MSSARRLVKNTFSMFVARGLQPFLSLLLALVIGRTLGPDLFGKYTVIFQLYFIFQITCSFGMRILLTREVAADKNRVNQYLINGTMLGIPAILVNIGIMLLLIKLMNYDAETANAAYVITISLVASGLADIFAGVLNGLEEIQKIAYGWIILLVVKTFISIAALLTGYGLMALVVIHVVTKFIQPVLYFYYIANIIDKLKIIIDTALMKKLLKMAWSLALLIVCISIFWRIDAIMLSKLSTNEVVGNYGAAFKIFWVSLLLVKSFFVAFFPMISSMYSEQNINFQKACRKALRYLTILIIPIALVSTFFAPHFMLLIWGEKFVGSIVILQVMIWALLPYAISEVFGSALVASRNQNTHLVLNAVSLIVKIVLNYFLILKFEAVGAAISSIIAIIFLVVIQSPFVISRLIRFNFRLLVAPVTKIVVAAAGMTALIFILNNLNFVVAAAVSGIAYLSILYILKLVNEEDKKYFNKVVKKTA
ncbi:oligosaccharide flippase family protein [candidate division KSB1 bacterium]|nr:oligosaccharide flippase family protein [candidate division KSB1 bacterium]